MNEDVSKVEKRLQSMRDFYEKASEVIDNLPEAIPDKTREMIKDAILGDKDLKNLMDGIDSHRPPRFFLIGRTGVGKSSLINALCGAYVAKVSDTTSCTQSAQIHKCESEGRVLMEILDTRGIAESETLNSDETAEEMLINQINEFSPDVAIFMLNCTHRDDVVSDVEFLKKVSKIYADINDMRLPIVVVVNKSDEMAPSRIKDPANYPRNKAEKINEMVRFYKGLIVKNGLKIDDIVAVSSLIEWKTADGEEIDVEDIDNLPQSDIDNLQISFDGRYQIDRLLDVLENAIQDFEAQMGLRMAARLNEVVVRVAKHLTKIFAAISATIALTPIPISDIYILLILQAILVVFIAALSGRDISLDAAREFIFGMGGIAGLGFLFRTIAQQGSKLINVIWPAAGSAVSSGVAYFGTSSIGKAAIAYYIEGKSLDEAKSVFKKSQDDVNEDDDKSDNPSEP